MKFGSPGDLFSRGGPKFLGEDLKGGDPQYLGGTYFWGPGGDPKTIPMGFESEILINYKRIKWTPSGKALLLSSQGDKNIYTDIHPYL